jgi:hypothetical protein
MLDKKRIRAPAVGLKKIFGLRPWIWQQWALLRFEKLVRFHSKHDDDFEEVDAQNFANKLWDEWIEDPRNADFKQLVDEMGPIAELELTDHIFSPFTEIDDITKDKDTWNFDDQNISAFTYLAVLGNGYLVPIVCVTMQFLIPMILLDTAVGDRGDGTLWKSLTSCNTVQWSTAPKSDEEGGAYNSLFGKTMVFLVVLFYFFKVVPDTLVSFYNTAGTADTTYSRIMSIRRILWDQGDDSVGQMVGFKMDLCE